MKSEWEQVEVVYRRSNTMYIWQQDNLGAPGSCKGARDYKLHCLVQRTRQQPGCVNINEDAQDEVVLRMLCYGVRYRLA